MTLPHPQPPTQLSLQTDSKPRAPLDPNSLISSSSSIVDPVSVSPAHLSDDDLYISDSDTLSSQSIQSRSDTYVNDLGGECVHDTDWPQNRVSRVHAYRVYDSTDDEEDPIRREARQFLDSADIGLYDEWAQIADDQLSLEDLQLEADQLTKAIDQVSMNPLPREPYHQPNRTSPSNSPHGHQPSLTTIQSPKPPRRRKGHRRIETLPDDDNLSDLPMTDFDLPPLPPPPPLPPAPLFPNTAKRGHRRIETLPNDDALDIIPRPGHRRIETLPDDNSLEIPTPPPLKRIEMLPDVDGTMPTPPPLPTPPSLTTPSSLGGVESLPDADMEILSVPTPPHHRRIETLPDVDLVNGEVTVLDRRRASRQDKEMMGVPEEMNPQRIETLSDGDSGRCAKLAGLSNRIDEVTRGLADVQMVTAGQAASAEACLGKTNKTSLRAEVCRLRITLDHLARLTLERAYKTRDEADGHG